MTQPSSSLGRLTPRIKLWLEMDGNFILGKGGALLLRAIEEHGSISQAVQALPPDALGEGAAPSYRFAWGYLRKVEERLGAAVVEKRRGYGSGVGGTALTEVGRNLLRHYERIEAELEVALAKASRGK
jgi:molybdate transport system regulatory protein